MREIDKRVIADEAELTALAKMYNVKAAVHANGVILRKIDKNVYKNIRAMAVSACLDRGGSTVEGLCSEIENLIRTGKCGLGRKTYYAYTRMKRNEPLPSYLTRR